jgi:hypothetical protein
LVTVLDGKRVDLGVISFGIVDDAGVEWRVDGLQGWDSAEVRSTVTQREAAHGAWMSPSYLGERIITLSGLLAAPTGAQLDGAVEQLLAAVPLDGFVTLTVYEAVPKQVSVRQSGKPLVTPIGDRLATWSLLVTAPDPRRYGTALRSASTGLPSTTGGLVLPAAPPWAMSAVTVAGFIGMTNEGSLTAYPVLAIAGPVQQPTVTVRYAGGTTAALTYAADLATGDVLTLDCQEHTAVVGGASRRRYVSGTWPEIPPGGADLLFGAPVYSPTATLTATWRPAWK